MRQFVFALVFVSLAGMILGCGGASYQYAPVSGKVTLNGKALAGASVEFQPVPSSKGVDPGSGSMGITTPDGIFKLKSQLENKEGAIVGKHRVRIYLYSESPDGGDRDADSGPPKKPKGPQIPARYNSATELAVDVPAAGLADYHFDLKSP